MWELPEGAAFVLRRLQEKGYRAYAVGGCVRDSLLGVRPKDWDICTSALPDEMQQVFADCHVVETGLKHGTLTVMWKHEPFEVTTFRVDGAYTDHRHPDSVTFVADVEDDLSRRDFTVNAMAWNPHDGLVDAFGGQEDLQAGLIRCVGEAEKRFREDALRILRALRFASVYGFRIEEKTAAAVHLMKDSLREVAAERIRVELAKLLCGKSAEDILRTYADVIFAVLPQLGPMHGFDQKTPYHRYDVWEHTIRAVAAAEPAETLRLAMLLHDSGKPESFSVDESGTGHAYGHARASVNIACDVLHTLKADHHTMERVLMLVEHHDIPLSNDKPCILRRLNQFGPEGLDALISVQRADGIGKGTADPEEINLWARQMRDAVAAVLAEKPCFTLRDLAVNGSDLMAAGVPKGKRIGEVLNRLLQSVMAGDVRNEKDELLQAAGGYID